MIEILIIIGSIMLIAGVICLLSNKDVLAFILGFNGAYLLSGGIMLNEQSSKPTAMDVYQGKTTLEITYKNGVAIDSVVVFKNAEK